MNFEKDIQSCLTALEKGGIILYPTDTVWGIGCDATNPEAVEKIFALKKRPDQKSMIILLADEKAVLQHVANPDLSVFEYLNTVMKPVTVIYEGGIGIAQNLVAKDGSVAIRIVKDEFADILSGDSGSQLYQHPPTFRVRHFRRISKAYKRR
jgi:L-threonylcarbamoyladenylate synthase